VSDRAVLDAALLSAHKVCDGTALAQLYTQAADAAEATGDVDATCFYLTHAYVFALEAGLPLAAILNARLADYGSDQLQTDLD